MHCNLRPSEPRQSLPALITPCQVWRRWTYPLPHYSVFVADTLFYAVTLTFDRVTLTCDLSSNLNAIEQSAAELLRFRCLTLWPWTCFKCCARLWDNFHQVWPSTTSTYLNYSVFWCWYVMSSCDLDLWPPDLNFYSTSGVMRLNFPQSLSEID